jgi:glyoxylase-like metal-dependent hydrolase (beta-lactamase superfamily II)
MIPSPLEPYKVYAIKYAERDGRRPDHFVGGDPHDVPMSMDYFVWLVRSADRMVLVDTGFDQGMAVKRGRRLLRKLLDALRMLGAAAEEVRTVVITHMHNDHVGTFFDFPSAVSHLQDTEMKYVTGRHMSHERLRRAYERGHIAGIVRLTFADRVVFHDGDEEIAPG